MGADPTNSGVEAMASIRRTSLILTAVLLFTAGVSMARVLTKQRSSIDFFSLIWYPGHFIWQGADPYAAALARRLPQMPVRYWDGPIATEFSLPIDPMPTNLSPIVLLFSPLARLSWPVASHLWATFNVALLPIIAWSIARLLGYRFFSWEALVILLTLCSLIATREAIELGQTSIITFASMLLAITVAPLRPAMAGVLLGIALSKYSLTFPGFLYFLCQRWYRSALIAGGIQGLSLLIAAAISQTSPLTIAMEHISLMLKHTNMPGLHLWAPIWQDLGSVIWIVLVVISVGLFLALARWNRIALSSSLSMARNPLASTVLLVVMMQWNLLALPHRRYDHVVGILFLALAALGGSLSPPRSQLLVSQSMGLQILAGLAAGIWILPLYYVLGENLYLKAFSLTNLAAFAVAVWMLFRATSLSTNTGSAQTPATLREQGSRPEAPSDPSSSRQPGEWMSLNGRDTV